MKASRSSRRVRPADKWMKAATAFAMALFLFSTAMAGVPATVTFAVA